MISIIEKNNCCGCHACYSACPKSCIKMEADNEGFLYPTVDTSSCIKCGLCEKVCPFLKVEPLRKKKPVTLAAKINDEEIRLASSSGGIFTYIAKKTLLTNGVVYGVAMNEENTEAIFIRVEDIDELRKIRGSKYLQANVGGVFNQVRTDLENGCEVLFSGVPCQVYGLKSFLGKEYNNLLTVEVLCHGVPSPKLWNKYLSHLQEKYDAKITNVNFREKKHGWHSFGLFEEGENITRFLSSSKDPYMIMFLKNYSLRPSCYSCKAKELESMADITLGDFWGIQNAAPELDDDMGTSVVFIQTPKGLEAIDSFKHQLQYKEVLFEAGVRSNYIYSSSVTKPSERKEFFFDMDPFSFDELEKRYGQPVKVQASVGIKNFAKRLLIGLIHGRMLLNNRFDYGLLIQMKKRVKKI